MNPLLLIGLSVALYIACEWLIGRLRSGGKPPSQLTFALGLFQSVAAVVLTGLALYLYIKNRN